MGGSGRDRDRSRVALDDMFPGRVPAMRADDMAEVSADDGKWLSWEPAVHLHREVNIHLYPGCKGETERSG